MKTKHSAEHYCSRIKQKLEDLLPQSTHSLHQAMRYSVLNGGKRIRPKLIYLTGSALGCPLEKLDTAAACIEMIHCYSLIHDDLPAMDDDDFRRNQPSCHKKFDEATAILAGDALLSLAIEAIVNDHLLKHETQCQLIKIISQANADMVLGQSLDLNFNSSLLNLEHISLIHSTKTASLFQAATSMAATVSECDKHLYNKLSLLGNQIGLAFQIRDDIIDHASSSINEPSYVNAIGHEKAEQALEQIVQRCLDLLSLLPFENTELRALVKNCAHRVL